MEYLEITRVTINEHCRDFEPWQLILGTFGVTIIMLWTYDLIFQQESLWRRGKKSFFRFVRGLPIIKDKIQAEVEKTTEQVKSEFGKQVKGMTYVRRLPTKGWAEPDVKKELRKYKEQLGVDWGQGGCSGCVYSGADDLTKLMADVYGEFAWTNPLHPDVFPEIRKMEAEVVRMCCTMFQGGPESCGAMTTGGTESIMLACKAYRDMAYDRGVKNPEMIVPVTAHAAFDKAASYFNIFIKHIPVDGKTGKADVAAMRRAITRNTCMLCVGAPSFPHGVIDPVFQVAQIGKKYKIPVHVDSCLGGFLIPFMKKAGYELDPFDFTVPGVTSISADTHKYGFAPKGSSVIMYSDKSYRKYQYFVAPDWPGGIYATSTFSGSRAGAIIAACWATMVYMGEDGYVESTKKIIDVAKYIEAGIRAIPHIYVCGQPEVSVIGIASLDFNIYLLSDAMTSRGWNLNALQFPASFHICCTLLHTKPGVADRFLNDVRECVEKIMQEPKKKCGGMGAMYGMAASIPDRSIVSEIAGCFFDGYYDTGSEPIANGTSHG